MTQFGGQWTRQKLLAVSQYLQAYVTAMKKQPFTLWYVDAFAGKGFSEHALGSAPLLGDDQDAVAFVEGSPLNALAVQPPFDCYLFIESDQAHLSSLNERIKGRVSDQSKVIAAHGDANEKLLEFCNELDSQRMARAVVFLDPFATQVRWQTVERLGRTGKVDLWILFPIMAVSRMLARDKGRQQLAWEKRLDEVFGSSDWRTAFYAPPSGDLFGGRTSAQRVVTVEGICQFYLKRLETVYGAVAKDFKMLNNSGNSPIFALMFAVASPSPAARRIALGIANHIIKNL